VIDALRRNEEDRMRSLYGPLLALVAAATAADDVCASSGPPWFSAAPAAKTYELERAGFDVCALCGGAERLGAVVDVDASHPTEDVAKEVLDAVRAHGVIIVKGQSLSRAEQVAFTAALGEVVVLPHSFEGKDPEPLHPEIQRVTNFFANGTWKGPATKFGAYWRAARASTSRRGTGAAAARRIVRGRVAATPRRRRRSFADGSRSGSN